MQLQDGKPNRVLSKMRSSDLTYVWTAEGWLYRTVVIESVLTPRGWLPMSAEMDSPTHSC